MTPNKTSAAQARINLEHLKHNYRTLQSRVPDTALMGIVKANAYGHGLDLIAPALNEKGCTNFGVSDAEEGMRLRDIMGNNVSIALLSGVHTKNEIQLAHENHLYPTVYTSDQLERLKTHGFKGRVWLKLNTGMNRLGFDQLMDETMQNSDIEIEGLMSHLACADTPDHPLNLQQFAKIDGFSRKCLNNEKISILNSAGICHFPQHAHDMSRPGIALYGAEPNPSTPMGLKPVMTLSGQIIQIRDIAEGESVSYGATYTAEQPTRIAIVRAGYADGIPRILSGRGAGWWGEQALPIAGRVCMDYTLLDVSDCKAKEGDAVEFWGEHLLANDVADLCHSISYELFTGVNARVPRVAV